MWMRETSVVLVAGLLLSSAIVTGDAETEAQDGPDASGQWDGFIACAVGAVALTWQTCGTFDVDPNDDWRHEFSVEEGLETLVVVMEWEMNDASISDELRLSIDDPGSAPDDSHARVAGGSPLTARIDDLNTTDGRDLRYRVFPAFDLQVVYQQPFTVTWYEFYDEEAPGDFDPLAS